jgi:hypothetical protein
MTRTDLKREVDLSSPQAVDAAARELDTSALSRELDAALSAPAMPDGLREALVRQAAAETARRDRWRIGGPAVSPWLRVAAVLLLAATVGLVWWGTTVGRPGGEVPGGTDPVQLAGLQEPIDDQIDLLAIQMAVVEDGGGWADASAGLERGLDLYEMDQLHEDMAWLF